MSGANNNVAWALLPELALVYNSGKSAQATEKQSLAGNTQFRPRLVRTVSLLGTLENKSALHIPISHFLECEHGRVHF